MKPSLFFVLSRPLAAWVLAGLLSGCMPWGGEKYLIPEKPNAKEQYDYAYQLSLQASRVPTADREPLYDQVIAAYRMVIDRFPDDRLHTPVALLDIGDKYAALKDYKTAMKYYTRAARNYPDNDRVQVYALVRQGQVYDLTDRGAKARDIYKQVIDRYAGRSDVTVRQWVQKARDAYDKVFTEGKSPFLF